MYLVELYNKGRRTIVLFFGFANLNPKKVEVKWDNMETDADINTATMLKWLSSNC